MKIEERRPVPLIQETWNTYPKSPDRMNRDKNRLRSLPVVVAQQPTDALFSFDRASCSAYRIALLDKFVIKSLVVPLGMIMRNIVRDDSSKLRFAKQNDLVQTFRTYR